MGRATLPRQNKPLPFKFVVMGERGVGKTAIIEKLVHDQLDPPHEPTMIPTTTATTITTGAQTFDVTITEANTDTYDREVIRDSHGIILVYDVGNQSSFQNIPSLYARVQNLVSADFTSPASAPPSVVVVGHMTERERQVSYAEGAMAAEALKCGFEESTAKGDVNHLFSNVIQRRNLSSLSNEERKRNRFCGFW
ncbi:P-loop containing nucleoside triphosphate hydrolase protein [Clohesyomyces aquaticus]|uniref:p-loop containing nucleoside triphosphate hydrolase protein n=1 Tax=Clohesyomyces aquaticus TaxID=1231657 RepID=A0A1Y1YWF7_9PLEO|nr:P-loop containing nucleoside triphosphate hydrolase protein [Clohesyomyces aquaticus]